MIRGSPPSDTYPNYIMHTILIFGTGPLGLAVMDELVLLLYYFSGPSRPFKSATGLEITSIQPLRNRALVNYVESRCISKAVAARYLVEVHYQLNDKHYYAVGFKNDKGGFELRNFKGGTSLKWFTSITTGQTGAVNVFEGVYDFLFLL